MLQRRHRQAVVGTPLQPVHERRAAAPHRLVVAGRGPCDRQRLRDQRQRPARCRCRKDGKLLWERSLAEEFGMWTTHGGRMSSPIIDGDQMIVSGLTFGWGQHRRRRAPLHLASTRATGQTIWVSAPEGRPTDTIYANPFVADVNGIAHVLLGRQRRRDARDQDRDRRAGLELAGQPARAEHRRAAASAPTSSSRTAKRTSATSEMGMVAAVPATSKGTLTDKDARWIVRGVQAGYALPGLRRRAHLPARQRRRPVRLRREDRQAAVERRRSARSRSPRRCWPTASCMSAPRTPDAGGKFYIIRPHARQGRDPRPGLARHPQKPRG